MKVSRLAFLVLLTSLFSFAADPGVGQNGSTDTTQGSRKVTNRVVPQYPAMARNMNLVGAVKLEALVSPSGTVKSVQVVGGNPLLVQSAQNAIREWKWEKAEHETTELIEFRFHP
jgi:TonB family protein